MAETSIDRRFEDYSNSISIENDPVRFQIIGNRSHKSLRQKKKITHCFSKRKTRVNMKTHEEREREREVGIL